MAELKSIAVDAVTALHNWRTAPEGSLLQVKAAVTPDGDDITLVGMRCNITSQPFLLILDGEFRGRLLHGSTLRSPALNVTKRMEVRIENPCPVLFGPVHYETYGIVCQFGAEPPCLFVRAILPGEVQVFVCLADPKKETPVGRGLIDMQCSNEMLVLGQTEVVIKPEA